VRLLAAQEAPGPPTPPPSDAPATSSCPRHWRTCCSRFPWAVAAPPARGVSRPVQSAEHL